MAHWHCHWTLGLWSGHKCYWIMSLGLLIEVCVCVPWLEPSTITSMKAQRYWWVRCTVCVGSVSHLKLLSLASWVTPFFPFTADAPATPSSLWIAFQKGKNRNCYCALALTLTLQIDISSALQYTILQYTIFSSIHQTPHWFSELWHILNFSLSPTDIGIFLWHCKPAHFTFPWLAASSLIKAILRWQFFIKACYAV